MDTADEAERPGSAAAWVLPVVAALVPLACSPWLIDSFELPKLLVLKVGLLIAALLVTLDRYVVFHPLRTAPALAALAFLTVSLLAAALSVAPRTAVFGTYLTDQGAITWVVQVAYFFVAALLIRTEAALRRFAAGLAIGAAVAAAYGVAQQFGVDPLGWASPDERRRAIGTLGQPDSLGEFLAMSLPLTAWLAWRGRGLQRDAALWAAALALVGLVVTQARAALAALVLQGLVLTVLLIATRRGLLPDRLARLIALAPPILATGVSLALLLLPTAAGRADALVGRGEPLQRRLELWRSAVAVAADRPVLGWGPDTFQIAYPAHRSIALDTLENVVVRPDTAHNLPLGIAAGSGVVGLAAWLAFQAAVFRRLVRATLADSADPPDGCPSLAPALLAVVSIYVVVSLFGRQQVTADWLAWVAAGAAVGLLGRRRPPPPVRPPVPARVVALLGAALLTVEGVDAVLADSAYAAAIQARQAGSRAAALDLARRPVDLRPFEPVYRQFLGLALEERARETRDPATLRQAADQLGAALALSGGRDAEMIVRLARVKAASGSADDRAAGTPWDEVERAARLDPENPLIYADAAELALDQSRPDLAAGYWEAAKRRSRTTDSLRRLGRLALRRGDPDGAREAFEAAIKPWWPDRTKIEYYRYWGEGALAAGLPDEAANVFAQALTLDQADVATRLDRAEALAAAGRREDALAEARRALDQAPEDPRATDLIDRLNRPS